ncbi:hypothetical protein R1flu_013712 [Riccia fluitans]|uniref:Cytochrome P450 n=1 Tax=Riccia fluitans TaxID=41844 RepID=A0ABD1YE31_9MARC
MSWSETVPIFQSSFGVYFVGVLSLLVFWRKFGKGRKLRLPPGPPGWPLLGHLPILGTMPHLSMMKLSQKYGPLMIIRLGTIRTVVVSSPEMAKIFLKTQDHLFATRPRTINGEVFMYNYQDMAFSPYNDHWRLVRRICETEIFSQKRFRNFKKFRDEEIRATVERMLSAGQEGKLVEIDRNMAQSSFDIMCRIFFSKADYFDRKVASLDSREDPVHLPSVMDEWCHISGSFFVGEYIPFLRKLDLGGFEARLMKLRTRFSNFLNPIIEEHRQKPEQEAQDFLDVLLSLQKDGSGDRLSDEAVKALLQNMLMGGSETDANTSTWALAELMRHPEIRQRLVDELDSVVGRDRLVEDSDLSNLHYLKATVKETFRMYPVVQLGVPHEAMEDTTVAGYDIPKGTRVLVNLYALGRNPTVWENPNTFDPERFMGKTLDVRGQHFEVLPFGAGRRQCPGMEMGIDRVELRLAQILQTCVLSLPPGMEVDVEEGVGLTLPRAHPLQVLVAPRLKPEVYSKSGIRL